MSLPVEIYSVASVRRIDDVAINDAGIGGYTLMCRAGAAAVEVAVAEFPDASRWQVVCGAGNNAGDGYVVARLAAERGIDVSVIAVTSPERLTGDAAQAYADFVAAGRALSPFDGTLDAAADLLIDALAGVDEVASRQASGATSRGTSRRRWPRSTTTRRRSSHSTCRRACTAIPGPSWVPRCALTLR